MRDENISSTFKYCIADKMSKQYGTNGLNSDGSLMNVGNSIWDPERGGRPSIRIDPQRSAMARTPAPWLVSSDTRKGTKRSPVRILFVCRPYTCWAQMAEWVLKSMIPSSTATISSAVLELPTRTGIEADTAMREVGINMRAHSSTSLKHMNPDDWDNVVTLCGCAAMLPVGWQSTHEWNLNVPFTDDATDVMTVNRSVRDELIYRCKRLCRSIDSKRSDCF